MKTKSMLGMLATVAIVVTTISSNASAQSGSSQHKYTDDAIVRDLKAGKLTVREAQILQQSRAQAAAKTAPPAAPAKSAGKAAHAAKPVKSGKAAAARKGKGKAPVKHLTSPHHAAAQHGQKTGAGHANSKSHGAKPAQPHHAAAAHGKSAKPVKPVKPVKKNDKAATAKTEPVRKTAVKYIR